MKEINEIKVENKFASNRNLLVFHGGIQNPTNTIVESRRDIKKDINAIGEYLLISVTREAEPLRCSCWIKLPSKLYLQFKPKRVIDIEIIHRTINENNEEQHVSLKNPPGSSDKKEYAFLKIPPGSPDWSLKITLPKGGINKPIKENISVGDDEP